MHPLRFGLALLVTLGLTFFTTLRLRAQTTVNYFDQQTSHADRSTETFFGSATTLTVNMDFGVATENGAISGSGNVLKTGDGTLTLAGNNTHSGGTTLSAGTLGLGGNSVLGSGVLTIYGGGIRAVNAERTIANTTIFAGNFTLGRATNFSGPISLTNNIIITSANPDTSSGSTSTLSGIISGNYGLTFAEGTNPIGAIIISGKNTYTGGTTINAGTVIAAATGEQGTFAANSAVTVNSGGTLQVNGSDALGWGGGAARLVVNGGTLTTDGTAGQRTTLQNVTLTGGRLTDKNSNGRYLLNGTLTTNANATSALIDAHEFELAAATLTVANGTAAVDLDITSTIVGSGSLTKNGAGLLRLTADNTYTGGTTISSGTLQLGAGGTTGSIVGNVVNNGTLLFNRSDAVTFSNVISGSGAVTKTGDNTLTLTNANTHTGGTILNAGTLGLGADNALGSGRLTINGGNLRASGSSRTLNNALTIAGDFTLGRSTTLAGAISLTNNITLTSANPDFIPGGSSEISNGIHGSYGITFADGTNPTGTLILSGANTYTGDTLLASGTLRFAKASAFYTNTINSSSVTKFTVATGAAAHFNVGGTGEFTSANLDLLRGRFGAGTTFGIDTTNATGGAFVYASNLAGSHHLTKLGGGVLALTGASTLNGTTTVASGTLQIGNNGTTGSFTGNIVNDAALVFKRTNALTHSGNISGSGILTQAGAGTLTLAGTNTYTGNTTVAAGTLQFAKPSAFYNGVIDSHTIARLTVAPGALAAFNVGGTGEFTASHLDSLFGYTSASALGIDITNATGGAFTYGSTIGGSIGLTKIGSGVLTLSADHTYTGNTTISAGTLVLTGHAAPSTFTVNSGAVLELTSDTARDYANNSTFTGAGTLRKTGTGEIRWGGSAATFALSSGSVIDVQAGSFGGGSHANENWLNNRADINVASGATFNGVESNVRVDALTGSGTITSGYNGADYTTFTFGVDNGSGTFSGILANTDANNIGSFTKAGTGTQTLSGNNTYTGGTIITAGTLTLGHANAVGSGPVAITGGTLNSSTYGFDLTRLSGTGVLDGSGAYTYHSSNSATVDVQLVGSASLTKSGTGTLTLTRGNGYTGGTTVNAGTLHLNGTNVLPENRALTINGGTVVLGGEHTINTLSGSGGTLDLGSNRLTLLDGIGGRNTTFSGVITGTGSLRKAAPSTITLSGNNTFTGGLDLTWGAIDLGHANALGTTGNVYLERDTYLQTRGFGFEISRLSGIGFVQSYSGAVYTYNSDSDRINNNRLGGAASLVKSGTGKLTLYLFSTADSYYSGSTTILDGTLKIEYPYGLAGSSEIIVNGGTLDLSADYNYTINSLSGTGGAVQLFSNTGRSLTVNQSAHKTFAGTIQGSGLLIKQGAGTLTLSGTNTSTGGTTVAAGTLQFAKPTAFYAGAINSTNAAKLTVSSGATAAFNVGGAGEFTTAEIALLANSGNFATGSAVGFDLTNAAGGPLTLGENLGGSFGLSKLGTGTLILSGTNTYTGATTVASGTLAVQGANRLSSSSAVFLTNGSSLDLNGTAQTVNGLGSAANRLVGNITAGTLTNNAATYLQSGTYAATLNGSSTSAQLWIGGHNAATVTLDGVNNTVYLTDHTQVVIGHATTGAAGTVKLGNANALAAATENIELWNGILDLNGQAGVRANSILLKDGANSRLVSNAVASNASFFNGLTLSGAHQLGGIGNLTLGGVLSGAGSFTKIGTGALTLSGNNTYTGAVTVSAGTVSVKHGNALGTTAANTTVNAGATLNLNSVAIGSEALSLAGTGVGNAGALSSNGTSSFAGAITLNADSVIGVADGTLALSGIISESGGARSLTKSGAGTLIVSGTNSYTGATTISAGTLQIGNGGTTGSLAGSIINGGTLTFNRSDAVAFSGVISGTGALTKTGGGTLTLTEANTYTGSTTVSEGTLQIGTGGTTGSLASSTLAIAATATVRFDRSTVSSFAGVASGTGTLVKNGAGNLSFSGASANFHGTLQINQGVFVLSSAGDALGDSSLVNIASGASFSIFGGDETVGSVAGAGTVRLVNRTLGVNHATTVELSGTIMDNGNVTKGGSGNWILSGNNTYVGTTTLNLGTLTAGSASAFGTGTVRVNTGTLNLANQAVSNALDVRGGSLTGLANYTGTQTLSTAINYSGTVGGTMIVASGGALNTSGATFTGATTVQSGGTIRGTGTLGALTLNSGATLAPGNSPGALATGSETWNGGATYVWEINDAANPATGAGTRYDLLSVSGPLTIAATSGNKFTLTLASLLANNTAGDVVNFNSAANSSYTIASATGGIIGFDAGAFTINSTSFTNALNGGSWNLALGNSNRDLNLNFTAAAIPEPSTYAMIIGILALGWAVHRKRPLSA
ncbi:beta strand repeat-containing protein [Oleiharenicola lentus]|uniref:beta strand repeat-containing protein n=1 Tax=Oleiharenicola lentus TaxID=2508720 RepID=UPI003F66A749